MSRRTIAMRRMSLVAGIFWLAVLAMGLSCQKPSRPRETVTKEQMITKLVEKGDRALPNDRETAYAAYRFAFFYAPRDSSIRAKYDAAKNSPIGLVANLQQMNDLLKNMVSSEDVRDFPASTPEMDLVNLRMLIDTALVGNLSYTIYSARQRALFATFPPHDSGNNSEEVCVFTSGDLYPLDEVRQLYGNPSTEVNGPAKSTWTYGRFRLIADGKNVRLILFPLFTSTPEEPSIDTPMSGEQQSVSTDILNKNAIQRASPNYPPLARTARVSGTVRVEVVVDEGGKVVSAHAVSGHPLLQEAAVEAAQKWRFKPFLSKDRPINVSGILEFNFTL